jgi:glycosyltransferase involved in cell wall biosynthesis
LAGVDQKAAAIRSADAIICVSASTRRALLDHYPEVRVPIYVVQHGCDPHFRPLINLAPPPRPFILYVGQRWAYKNFALLLAAYQGWAKNQAVDLVVVGENWSKAEKKAIGPTPIRLLTQVDDDQLCQLYHQASALVYPSLAEGFGLPVVEALACACPVVASRIPPIQEIAADCPLYFNPHDPADLIAALDQALAEGKNTPRTQAGIDLARAYTWEKSAQATWEIFQKIHQKGGDHR